MERGESFTRPIVLPSVRSVCLLLSGRYTARESAPAAAPGSILPFFAQQVDHSFLSYAWHLTEIWDTCETAHGKGKQASVGSTVIFSYHVLSFVF